MTKKDKRIERFKKIKGEASFYEARKVLEIIGYEIIRMRGSHFIFEKTYNGNSDFKKITIPVHSNKIKKRYVRSIKEIIKKTYGEI